MKLIEVFPIKQFNVDLYKVDKDISQNLFDNISDEKVEENNENYFYKYLLMLEQRYMQISFGKLRDYLRKSFSGITIEEDDDIVGISLLTIDSESQGEVKIKQTQKGYKIDCLELTTQEAKELYLQINKFIRNYERSIDEK